MALLYVYKYYREGKGKRKKGIPYPCEQESKRPKWSDRFCTLKQKLKFHYNKKSEKDKNKMCSWNVLTLFSQISMEIAAIHQELTGI